MGKKLNNIPKRERVVTGTHPKIQKKIYNFFIETKEHLNKKLGESPHYEIKSENIENSDNRLTYLLYKDKLVAGVVERRTEFNNLEYVFFRDLSRL